MKVYGREVRHEMNCNLQPTLENELVLVRPLGEKDFEPLHQVAKDPLIWEQHPCYDRYRKDVFKTFFKDSLESKGALVVIDRKTDKVIGSSRFKKLNGIDTAVEIGWSFLSRKYWGGQYNRSVKTLMINHAFGTVHNIIFYIGPDNIRSQKAVMKIGAKRIAGPEFKNIIRKSNNNLAYRLSRKDWNSVNSRKH